MTDIDVYEQDENDRLAGEVGYSKWDSKDFIIPPEYQLDDNSKLHEALNVFYAAGGYDFFKVFDPEKYASNWLEFIGRLYSDIEDGKYQNDGKSYNLPLSDDERNSLIEQGVPEVFTKDIR